MGRPIGLKLGFQISQHPCVLRSSYKALMHLRRAARAIGSSLDSRKRVRGSWRGADAGRHARAAGTKITRLMDRVGLAAPGAGPLPPKLSGSQRQ